MSKKLPIRSILDKSKKRIDILMRSFYKWVRFGISEKHAIDKAVDIAVKKSGFLLSMKRIVATSAINGIKAGAKINAIVDATGIRKKWLDTLWPGEDLTLSGKINKLSRMSEFKSTLKKSFRDAATWQKTAKNITDAQLNRGDVAKIIMDLERQSKKLLRGDSAVLKKYKSTINKAQRHVERLAENNASKGRLKKAYQRVIDATKKLDANAIDRAIVRAIDTKARYNAERIARTETARAYGQGTYESAINDRDVVGMRYDLSADHNIYDICDFHTSVNMYGLGPGGYPLSDLPPYPFHPNCTCVESHIYAGEYPKPKKDTGKAEQWIQNRSKEKQKALLGRRGMENVNKNPKTWHQNLNNYKGHHSIYKLYKGVQEK